MSRAFSTPALMARTYLWENYNAPLLTDIQKPICTGNQLTGTIDHPDIHVLPLELKTFFRLIDILNDKIDSEHQSRVLRLHEWSPSTI